MVKKTVFVVVAVAIAYAGFRWGGQVFPPLERALGIDPAAPAPVESAATPEMAEDVVDRLERFRAGELGDRLALSSVELTSMVRYALPGILPGGVAEPVVDLEDGRVNVTARVAVESFPDLPRLDAIIGILPDTLLIQVRGSLIPLDQRSMTLMVDRLSAARIPIPRRMVADMLNGLGRNGPPALPSNGLQVPRPDGIDEIFVQQDSLVLLAEPAAVSTDGTGEG